MGGNMEKEEIIVLDEGIGIDEWADDIKCCKPMPSTSQ